MLDRLAPWCALLLGLSSVVLAIARPGGAWWPAIAALAAFAISAVATEIHLRKSRPFEAHGRLARWRHPARNPLARLADGLANSRLVSTWVEPLPIAAMVSEIEDVIYVNYLVRAETVERFVPWGLELERLGPDRAWALFSFLTYRHGHFAFRFLGPLRRLFPSPVQTNWRIHVRDPRTGVRGVYFITNAIDYAMPALAARLFTEAMPMHVFARSSVRRDPASGSIEFAFEGGDGSAPSAQGSLAPCEAPTLEGPWRECFESWEGFLEYCVPQNRAMSGQPWHRRVTRHEIVLPIDLAKVEPLRGAVVSATASEIAGDSQPLCMRVAGLHFTFEAELHDPALVETSTSAAP